MLERDGRVGFEIGQSIEACCLRRDLPFTQGKNCYMKYKKATGDGDG